MSAGTVDAVERLAAARILAVATVDDAESAWRLAHALLEGGVSCLELTLRTDAAITAIERCSGIQELLVGAGTVLESRQVAAAAAAGARFAVAPCFQVEVVEAARDARLPFFPGVATASELATARAHGVDVVKAFPAEQLGGPAWLAALAAVYPDVRFVPTGGIDLENARGYLELPAVLAIGGSWLAPAPVVRSGDFDEVTRRARAAAALAVI